MDSFLADGQSAATPPRGALWAADAWLQVSRWSRALWSRAEPDTGGVLLAQLRSFDRPAIEAHLVQLSSADRTNRFMGAVDDDYIRRYVAGIDFARDIVVGALSGPAVVGFVHAPLCRGAGGWAVEAGISVQDDLRGKRLGLRLLTATMQEARSAGIGSLQLRFLASNRAMGGLARRVGARVSRATGESTATVVLAGAPPPLPQPA